MRSLGLVIALFCGWNVFAAETPGKLLKGFLISSELSYEAPGRKVKTERSFILSENNQDWTPLVNPKDGVTLLGRMIEKTDTTIHMEYMIIDTAQQNSVLSTSSIISRLGEEAKIEVKGGGHVASVSVLAKKTDYGHQKE